MEIKLNLNSFSMSICMHDTVMRVFIHRLTLLVLSPKIESDFIYFLYLSPHSQSLTLSSSRLMSAVHFLNAAVVSCEHNKMRSEQEDVELVRASISE